MIECADACCTNLIMPRALEGTTQLVYDPYCTRCNWKLRTVNAAIEALHMYWPYWLKQRGVTL